MIAMAVLAMIMPVTCMVELAVVPVLACKDLTRGGRPVIVHAVIMTVPVVVTAVHGGGGGRLRAVLGGHRLGSVVSC